MTEQEIDGIVQPWRVNHSAVQVGIYYPKGT